MCMGVVYMCNSVPSVCALRLEEGIESPGIALTNGRGLPCEC